MHCNKLNDILIFLKNEKIEEKLEPIFELDLVLQVDPVPKPNSGISMRTVSGTNKTGTK